MTEKPENRNVADFIVKNGGIGRSVLYILAHDGIQSIANPTFWGLLIHFLFIHAYLLVLAIGMPLAVLLFFYLAFAPGVDAKTHSGAVTSLIIAGVLIGLLLYDKRKNRKRK